MGSRLLTSAEFLLGDERFSPWFEHEAEYRRWQADANADAVPRHLQYPDACFGSQSGDGWMCRGKTRLFVPINAEWVGPDRDEYRLLFRCEFCGGSWTRDYRAWIDE